MATNEWAEYYIYTGQPADIIPRYVTHVRVPSTVRGIGDDAFKDCAKLIVVEICEGLEFISSGAFTRCSLLKHIKVPSTVRRIGDDAFKNCRMLKTVELCEGLEFIIIGAFEKCD